MSQFFELSKVILITYLFLTFGPFQLAIRLFAFSFFNCYTGALTAREGLTPSDCRSGRLKFIREKARKSLRHFIWRCKKRWAGTGRGGKRREENDQVLSSSFIKSSGGIYHVLWAALLSPPKKKRVWTQLDFHRVPFISLHFLSSFVFLFIFIAVSLS